MVKGFDEFAEEFKRLRQKMNKTKNVTPKLAASWTSQLAGSAERLSNRMDLMDAELQAIKQKLRSGKGASKPAKKKAAGPAGPAGPKKKKSMWPW